MINTNELTIFRGYRSQILTATILHIQRDLV